MAESGGVFSKELVEIDSLKETLRRQQKLLQKLYNELEVEREASSTAASEALSMILRLQGEKAAVKMEAEQYRRLVDEKMCHAEESLTIFEDLICQKEMEVASLDYQVQAYRYKLLSMGCTDPGIGDIKFPENLLQRNENLVADAGAQSLGRRNSAPPLSLKFAYQRIIDRDNSSSPERELISKILEEQEGNEAIDQGSDSERRTDSTSSVVGINSYWEEIRKLDGRVREIAGVNYSNLRSETSSSTPLSSGNSSATRVIPFNGIDQVKVPVVCLKNETIDDSTSSQGVLDVFEVPQVELQDKTGLLPKDEGKMVLPADDRLQRPDSVPLEALKSEFKDETDWLKNLLRYSRERNLGRPSEVAATDNHQSTSSVNESRPMSNQFRGTSEIVEDETQTLREESSNREEELSLLHGIKEQLNAIESDIRSLKTTSSSRRDKMATVSYLEASLAEAMLHFWL